MTDPAAVVSAMILRFECLTSSALMRGVLLAVAGSTEFGAQVSKQLLELLHVQPGIPNDATHGYCVYRVISWDGNKTYSVGHDDVFALPDYLEARLFQGSHGSEMRNTGDLGQFRLPPLLPSARRLRASPELPPGIP